MWTCLVCGKSVAVSNKPGNEGLPSSMYWAERDNAIFDVMPADYVKVFCGAQCSLDWYQEQLSKEKSPPSSSNDSKSKGKSKG